MVYASGPLCSEQSCEYWHRCRHNSVKEKDLRTAENITLCHGLGPCNLAFWREREVFEQVGGVSEGDILWIEGDYSGSSFNDLPSVYVSRLIEHIKK